MECCVTVCIDELQASFEARAKNVCRPVKIVHKLKNTKKAILNALLEGLTSGITFVDLPEDLNGGIEGWWAKIVRILCCQE